MFNITDYTLFALLGIMIFVIWKLGAIIKLLNDESGKRV